MMLISCGSTPKRPSKTGLPDCPAEALLDCESLYVPQEGMDVRELSAKWGAQYMACKSQNEVKKECIKRLDKFAKDNF